ncbi:hypothetical protein PENSPDRAFT_654796 [Peniophora sp. CONT]|nr:hypothetical protein PENSPDRAFT_654796 [Peniophora sp. CONT]
MATVMTNRIWLALIGLPWATSCYLKRHGTAGEGSNGQASKLGEIDRASSKQGGRESGHPGWAATMEGHQRVVFNADPHPTGVEQDTLHDDASVLRLHTQMWEAHHVLRNIPADTLETESPVIKARVGVESGAVCVQRWTC